MTLKEARAWMLSNPGKKITCQYFHDEWIMFDGSRFVFEDGVEPDSWWWAKAYEFKCEWYELKEKMESVISKEKPKDVDKKECQHEWKYEGDEMRGHYNSLYERNLYTCVKCGKQKYSKF